MKQITEKQIVEWKAELNVQRQKKLQAEQVLDEINRAILMIEGGIQFGDIALKKFLKEGQQVHKEDLETKSKIKQSK